MLCCKAEVFEWMIGNFKRRWDLRTVILHGEEGDTNEISADTNLRSLCEKRLPYAQKDCFNTDEYKLNYSIPADKTNDYEPSLGHKKAKEHIKIPFCSNSDGGERFEPMFIGCANKLRFLRKRAVTILVWIITTIKRQG